MRKEGNHVNLRNSSTTLTVKLVSSFCVYLREMSKVFLFLFATIPSFAQNDTLLSATKGGKKLIPDTLHVVAKTDTLPQDTFRQKKKWDFPPTTEAAQRWEKKAYLVVLQQFPKQISSIFMPLDTNRQDPNVAYKRALILPGWGQAYNRSYWKIPIVYAGLGGLGYWFYFNNQQYKIYQTAYRYSIDGDSTTNPLNVPNVDTKGTSDGFRAARDQYRRDRDLSVIYIAAFYVLQAIEAYTNAHLKYFDVEENLSMQVAPTLMQTSASVVPRAGIGVSFRF